MRIATSDYREPRRVLCLGQNSSKNHSPPPHCSATSSHVGKPRIFVLHLQSQPLCSIWFDPNFNSILKSGISKHLTLSCLLLFSAPQGWGRQAPSQEETRQISSSSEIFPTPTWDSAPGLRRKATRISSVTQKDFLPANFLEKAISSSAQGFLCRQEGNKSQKK